MLKKLLYAVYAVVCALSLMTTKATAQVMLVPYGSSDYRYGYAGLGWELPGFDDSAYPLGCAPFSSGDTFSCGSAIYAACTHWEYDVSLMVRLHFNLSGAPRGVLLRFGIDNYATIYLNGQLLADVHSDGCAQYDSYIFAVPDGLLHPGDNVLAALLGDSGLARTFDVSLTADAVTAVNRNSWGQLKAHYR